MWVILSGVIRRTMCFRILVHLTHPLRQQRAVVTRGVMLQGEILGTF